MNGGRTRGARLRFDMIFPFVTHGGEKGKGGKEKGRKKERRGRKEGEGKEEGEGVKNDVRLAILRQGLDLRGFDRYTPKPDDPFYNDSRKQSANRDGG
jgi:hypothetical protein